MAEEEPCAEPEPPPSAREPLDEPGIADDYKDQCDCDGHGNELPEGSYIVCLNAIMNCPWCVWKESLSGRTVNNVVAWQKSEFLGKDS